MSNWMTGTAGCQASPKAKGIRLPARLAAPARQGKATQAVSESAFRKASRSESRFLPT
jgi:hypothetical protein